MKMSYQRGPTGVMGAINNHTPFANAPPQAYNTDPGASRGNGQMSGQDNSDENNALREQLEAQRSDLRRLQATVGHFRAWAAQLQARYTLFSPDAARPAKRVYIGNLPTDTTEQDLRQFINDVMVRSGGCSQTGFPVLSCKFYLSGGGSGGSSGQATPTSSSQPTNQQNTEKSYAFIEFRSVEESSNCMAFDGIKFGDSFLKIRRPNNYDINIALMLGPTEPSPGMDFTGMEIVRTVVADSPHKLFVGGLPCDWTEDQVKEMLFPFGQLKAFNLVMDRNTGNSKGYAFCEYMDVGNTDHVIQALHGKPVGNKFLTVKRALMPAPF